MSKSMRHLLGSQFVYEQLFSLTGVENISLKVNQEEDFNYTKRSTRSDLRYHVPYFYSFQFEYGIYM